MAVAKAATVKALPTQVNTASFLDADKVVAVTTKTSYERGKLIAVTGAYVALVVGEIETAIPWSNIVKVEGL